MTALASGADVAARRADSLWHRCEVCNEVMLDETECVMRREYEGGPLRALCIECAARPHATPAEVSANLARAVETVFRIATIVGGPSWTERELLAAVAGYQLHRLGRCLTTYEYAVWEIAVAAHQRLGDIPLVRVA